MEPIIRIKNLRKSFGDFWAVKDVSFEVYPGEIFGLLGPNGAGKTTTLEMLETLLKKTDGDVLIDNKNLDTQKSDIRQIIGVQLQSGGYFPDLNLIETLELFAATYNVKVDPLDLLRRVDLESKAKSRVDQMSGGQQQRFSIATTLIASPKVIFLDEPTTGLDPQARRNLWVEIQKLKTQGITIILTTHYLDEAEYLCDRIAIMDEGTILKIDTPVGFITSLLDKGFKKDQPALQADLEDVFLDITGKELRE